MPASQATLPTMLNLRLANFAGSVLVSLVEGIVASQI